MNNFTNEQIISAIDNAPEIVQDTVHSGDTAKAIAKIGAKYRLHIDVVGKLAELNRNLLVGLMSPAEILGTLVTLNLDADTAKKIMADLNEMIFIPVREKMKNNPVPPISSYASRVNLQENAQKSPLVPPLSIDTAPASPNPAPAAPTQGVNLLVDRPIPTPTPARTMASDMQMAQAQPAIQTQVTYGAQQPAPAPGWQHAAQVHVYVPHAAPAPTPHIEMSMPIPSPILEPVVQKPAVPTPVPAPSVPATPLNTSYGSDPYREPIT